MSKTKWTPKAATPEALAALAERCKGRTGGAEAECVLSWDAWNAEHVEVTTSRLCEADLFEEIDDVLCKIDRDTEPRHPPGLDSIGVPWSTQPAKWWKGLRVGRKLLYAGVVSFGYAVPDERRAIVTTFAPRVGYLVGCRRMLEGYAWSEPGSYHDYFGTYEGPQKGFTPTRSVFVLDVVPSLDFGAQTTIPALCRLSTDVRR